MNRPLTTYLLKLEKSVAKINQLGNVNKVYYNPKIHGPYCEWRWYGEPDKKFMEVKLTDVPAWLARRNYHPLSMLAEVKRNYHYLRHLYIDPPYKNPYWVALNVIFWVVAFYTIIFEFIMGHKRTTLQKNYYH
uniref:Uncharacterized protein n=1 Tax=Acrobeloides nanus TaxID=290746 RepID=A0A914DI24_9BILA